MPPSRRSETLLSASQVKELIEEGNIIVILGDKALKLDSWLRLHPGGDKAILHMVGRDATGEINAFHSEDAKSMMGRYQIGRVKKPWTNCTPPIQNTAVLKTDAHNNTIGGGLELLTPWISTQSIPDRINIATLLSLDLDKYPGLDTKSQTEIMERYQELDAKLHSEGLYNCNYAAYIFDALRCFSLFFLMITFLRWGWYTLSAICLGGFWHQLVFVVHDAGHMGITHNWQIDTLIGMFLGDFIGGLSLGWWKHNHNIHHVVTNAPEHGPDIEHLPFLAVSHRFFASLRSTYYDRVMQYTPFAPFTMRYQAYLYYVVLTFGRFNLYVLSWSHLLFGRFLPHLKWHRYFEIFGELIFWYWFGYSLLYRSIPNWSSRLTFLFVSHMVTMPLHVQFSVSHFAMSTADLGPSESFPQRMLRTTMDVDCPPWLDFLHGGLQFQAVHHLFPRLPRHNLRMAQVLVRAFCEETGIPYALYGFVESNERVIARLGEVSRQAAILAKCQEAMAQEVASGFELSEWLRCKKEILEHGSFCEFARRTMNMSP